MNDEQLAAAYQARMRQAKRPPDAPDPDVIRRVADGSASEEERLQVLDLVMQSEPLRREFDLFRALAAGQAPARRAPRPWLALAAGLLVTVMVGSLWWRQQAAAPGPFRGGADAVTLLVPAEGARVERPVVLTWGRVPEATGYDVDVLAGDGATVFATTGTDTMTTLPDSVPLRPGQTYVWRVVASLPDGRKLTSSPASFTGAP